MLAVAILGSFALVVLGCFYRPIDEELTRSHSGETLQVPLKAIDLLKYLLLFTLGLAACISLISFAFSTGHLNYNTVTNRLSHQLQLEAQDTAKNIIILDGGSYTHRAIDGKSLEQSLANQGFSVKVYQASLPGANHFERARILVPLLSELQKRNDIGQSRIIYLREAHSGYDTYPLYQVRDVNDRVVAYSSPISSWRQIKAMRSSTSEPLTAPQKEAESTLLKATGINALGIGRLREAVRRADLKPYPGYNPIEKNRKPVPAATIEKAATFMESHILGPNAATGAPSARAKQRWAWSQDSVSSPLNQLKSQLVDVEFNFLPITTNLRDIRYFNSFCRDQQNKCLFVDQRYVELTRGFDSDDYWSDPNHLSILGAEAYTDWLANKIIDQAGLEK